MRTGNVEMAALEAVIKTIGSKVGEKCLTLDRDNGCAGNNRIYRLANYEKGIRRQRFKG